MSHQAERADPGDAAAGRTVFKAGGLGAPPVIAAAPAPGGDAPWMGGSSDRYGQGVRGRLHRPSARAQPAPPRASQLVQG
jgi:hypothetical protein